jgi:hypothetical protein
MLGGKKQKHGGTKDTEKNEDHRGEQYNAREKLGGHKGDTLLNSRMSPLSLTDAEGGDVQIAPLKRTSNMCS